MFLWRFLHADSSPSCGSSPVWFSSGCHQEHRAPPSGLPQHPGPQSNQQRLSRLHSLKEHGPTASVLGNSRTRHTCVFYASGLANISRRSVMICSQRHILSGICSCIEATYPGQGLRDFDFPTFLDIGSGVRRRTGWLCARRADA